MASRLESALALAGLSGVPVFPCVPLGKRPACAHGFQEATTDVDQITEWWTTAPDCNLAVPTGLFFDVIDVDGLEGANALEEWIDEQGEDPRLYNPTVLTPSGGYHVYVGPTGVGNRAGWLTHVDYRGIGGYVLVPPSRTEKGEYRWF
jgi:hypothetical protein